MAALKERSYRDVEAFEDDWFEIKRGADQARPRFQLLRGQFSITEIDESNLPVIHLVAADITDF